MQKASGSGGLKTVLHYFNIRNLIIVISVAVLIGVVAISFIFDTDSSAEFDISVSHESGFYDEEFDLEMTPLGYGEIHYTLDGSEPTKASPVYNGKIHISDATNNPNIYSNRDDLSVLLKEELVKISGRDDLLVYRNPDYNVDKCVVLRAVLIDKFGNASPEKTRTFFVGFNEKKGYTDIYKISIISDPDNFFNYDNGIYVTGSRFDEYTDYANEQVLSWPSNYFEEGEDFTKPCYIEIFNDNNEKIISQDCSVKVQGGAPRTFPQKSLGFIANKTENRKAEFSYDLYGNGKKPKKIKLSNSGNDNRVRIKDYIVENLVKNSSLNVAVSERIPCAAFLDGEYFGLYYLQESFNADFISSHFGVAEDNVIIIKNGELAEGKTNDFTLYEEMENFPLNNDMRDDSKYDEFCNIVDIESLIDYFAIETYIRNTDWPGNNVELWRSRSSESGMYKDGKWRWILFDLNDVSVMHNFEGNNFQQTIEREPMFGELLKNERFRQQFKERMSYIAKDVLNSANINLEIDNWEKLMKEPVKASEKRFFKEDDNAYTDEINMIKDFFLKREEAMNIIIEELYDSYR